MMGQGDMTDNQKIFTSLLQVKDYLIDQGYKVSKSKIYRDAENGKITAQTDAAGNKSVSALAAWEYAEKHLEKTGVNKSDLKNLQSQKLMNAIKIQEIEHQRKSFDLEKEQGKYIPRADFESELAARAAVLESGFRHLFNVKAREWIAIVGGKPERTADFLAALNTGLDEQLNTYATTQVFQVIFEDKDDEPEPSPGTGKDGGEER
jgi:hypothetical protein